IAANIRDHGLRACVSSSAACRTVVLDVREVVEKVLTKSALRCDSQRAVQAIDELDVPEVGPENRDSTFQRSIEERLIVLAPRGIRDGGEERSNQAWLLRRQSLPGGPLGYAVRLLDVPLAPQRCARPLERQRHACSQLQRISQRAFHDRETSFDTTPR